MSPYARSLTVTSCLDVYLWSIELKKRLCETSDANLAVMCVSLRRFVRKVTVTCFAIVTVAIPTS